MSMAAPELSVVIAAYDVERWIAACLESVLRQEGPSFEIIVVDDHSRDRTPRVVEELGDPRIRLIVLDRNTGGPAAPRNRGAHEARGALLSFFDADDVMEPHRIARSVRAMAAAPEAGLAFTRFRQIDESDRLLAADFLAPYPRLAALPKQAIEPGVFRIAGRAAFGALIEENFVGTSSVTVRKALFDDVGGFDTTLRSAEDRDLWFRLARRADFVFVDEVLHAYRSRAGSLTKGDSAGLAQCRIEVLERQRPFVETPGERAPCGIKRISPVVVS
ncbi:MAG: glycosyltransferase family 2 protein [Acidobacteria bacterium]|nr:glycosyltransferase family 2 protein [Acidobacteriota bacterium]